MNRADAYNKLKDGKFHTVTFKKSDGTTRVLNGRMGVRKHLRGGIKAYSDSDKGIVTLYDVKSKGYRSIRADRIISIR